MKILFVYRGYGRDLSNSVIDFQRASLVEAGINVDSFAIRSGGIKGYVKSLKELKKILKQTRYDLIHAHYSFSGFLVRIATRKPVVCSLMGSDVLQQSWIVRLVTWFFHRYLWSATIVKSTEIQKKFPRSLIIPNGVDFLNFREINKKDALIKTGFDPDKKNTIFVAQDPDSEVKNLSLAKVAIQLIENDSILLHLVSGKTFEELPYYYNAADLLILTSLSEGSPNVIKEAMACNCPIVATDVGDIADVIKDTPGCYLTSFNPADVAEKIRQALAFGKRTNGREKIRYLDNKIIAEKIIGIYRKVI